MLDRLPTLPLRAPNNRQIGIDLLLVQRLRRETAGEKLFLDAKHPELHREVFEPPRPIGQAREAASFLPAHI